MDIGRLYFNIIKLHRLLPYYLSPGSAFPPLHVFFEITFQCNLRCSMCHFLDLIEEANSQKKKEELSFEEIKQIVSQLPWFSLITFTGGEPFIRKDILQILRFASSKNKCHIITNGTLINEKIAGSLVEMRSKTIFGKGLFAIGISLEGTKETNDKIVDLDGAYEKTIKGIELIQEQKVRNNTKYPVCHLTTVLSNKNVNDLVDLYKIAEDLKMDVYNVVLENSSEISHSASFEKVNNLESAPSPVSRIEPHILKGQLDRIMELSKRFNAKLRFSPANLKPEEVVRYYSDGLEIKNFKCFVPWNKVGITAYGGIASCPHFYMGNIRDNGNLLSWNNSNYSSFRKKLREQKIFPRCTGCCQSEYIK